MSMSLLPVAVELGVFLSVHGALAEHMRRDRAAGVPRFRLFRFFTILSNLLAAWCCLSSVILRYAAPAVWSSRWFFLLRFSATAAVTMTMITVFVFLGPVAGYKPMLGGPNFFLHFFCPVLTVAALLLSGGGSLSRGDALWGALPAAVYGTVYLYQVVFAPKERGWPDFYHFNIGGRWYLAYPVIVGFSYLLSLGLTVLFALVNP